MAKQNFEPEIDSRLEGLDRFVNRCLKDWQVPGAAIGIVRDGQMIYARGFGLRDVRRQLPVDKNTHFAIGSCTKAFTATSVGILVDEGKIEWNKPVRDYLPSFRLKDTVAAERTTPRDLLSHRTGLPRHDHSWYGAEASRSELFKRLRHLEPTEDFRSLFQYQNLMYLAAGVLIEEVSGLAWEEFVRQRILKPLGIVGMSFSIDDLANNPNASIGHYRKKGRTPRIPYRNIDAIAPAGGINSNVLDMCRWLQLQLNPKKAGRRRIIKTQTLKELHIPHTVLPESFVPLKHKELLDASYAMGWIVHPYRGYRWLHHGGSIDGFNALTSFMPWEDLGVVVLTNVSGSPLPQVVSLNIYDRLLDLDPVAWNARAKRDERKARRAEKKRKVDKERKRGTKPSLSLKDYSGIYRHSGYSDLEVACEKRKLTICYNGESFRMKHYHHDIFEISRSGVGLEWKMKAAFQLSKSGETDAVSVPFEPTGADITFKKAKA